MAKMAEQENPNLTFSHGHTKITVISRVTIDEKDQRLAEKIFLQLKIKGQPH